jgi:hypothetical protein
MRMKLFSSEYAIAITIVIATHFGSTEPKSGTRCNPLWVVRVPLAFSKYRSVSEGYILKINNLKPFRLSYLPAKGIRALSPR